MQKKFPCYDVELHDEMRFLLTAQCTAMSAYYDILRRRVILAGGEVKVAKR
jgi:hypothetical protein